jgi:hypothetical protein
VNRDDLVARMTAGLQADGRVDAAALDHLRRELQLEP